ncbi:MAG: 3-methyl-2-oxobutanoate hydroxymethyltransferase [Pirellulales bacterium]|nr:3-methyl-2-oxobutanoate hydroxymethyltransferase [Pirellulales bacterium]
MTVPKFSALKNSGRKIAMATAYDHAFGRLVDAAGVDAVLVGDSLAMVVQGRENTLPVTLDEMIYHAELVGRAVTRALVVVDMPFPTYHLGPAKAIDAAGRILKESRCQAVKLEGGESQADTIAALVKAGIPVMAHCGLGPQSVHQLGGYRVQRDERRILQDARAAAEAGAFAMVLECIPAALAMKATEAVEIPTIGIGAGPGCDGQVLVLHDVLGLSEASPRFVKQYADLSTATIDAVQRYCEEVRSGAFPAAEHGYE